MINHLQSHVRIAVATLVLALPASTVSAQQQKWRPLDAGFNDEVEAAIAYRGDLIVGGDFTHADGIPAQGIALWDGNTWQNIDDGFVDSVNALHVHGGLLYAGGTHFTNDPGDPIAPGVFAWDGQDWTLLDDGTEFHSVNALTTFNGELVIACWKQGSLTPQDRDYVVMRWDGAQWHALGGEFYSSGVNALAVHNGELIAAGGFNRNGLHKINGIARWDGTTWQRLGNGLAASGLGQAFREVHDLQVYDGKLIAAGSFAAAGGRVVRNIARWNGSEWRSMDGGADATVFGLAVYQNDLIAIGQFQRIGGVNAKGIARWDVQHGWRPLGKGFNTQGHCLTAWKGGLVAGGAFWKSGTREVNHIALWPRE